MEKREDMIAVSYESAQPADEAEILHILKEASGDESIFDINSFVVARQGSEIVGCVRIKENGDTLELSSLAVKPEFRDRGIGSALVREVLSKESRRPIFLITSSDKETYYKKFGAEIADPDSLPIAMREEYDRIINLPFAKGVQVIVMSVG